MFEPYIDKRIEFDISLTPNANKIHYISGICSFMDIDNRSIFVSLLYMQVVINDPSPSHVVQHVSIKVTDGRVV